MYIIFFLENEEEMQMRGRTACEPNVHHCGKHPLKIADGQRRMDSHQFPSV